MQDFLTHHPECSRLSLASVLQNISASAKTRGRFSDDLLAMPLFDAVQCLNSFDAASIKLIQAFYRVRADEIRPLLHAHGFNLVRITSRGTEIYPTMCDLEKRDVDRYRIEIDPTGPLAAHAFDYARIQCAIMAAKGCIVARGWIISETMLNRNFIDAEGDKQGKEITGVSRPYAMNLGTHYATAGN
jgi:hypothetical protein